WPNYLLVPVRMPLFAFLSGYVFQSIARNWIGVGSQLRVKARRLLFPLVCVGTIHFLLQSLIQKNDISSIWRVYFTSYEHFWYLQATFIVMTVALVASALLQGRAGIAAFVCLVLSLPLYVLNFQLQPDNWFSITKVFYIAPFFFAGQAFRMLNLD